MKKERGGLTLEQPESELLLLRGEKTRHSMTISRQTDSLGVADQDEMPTFMSQGKDKQPIQNNVLFSLLPRKHVVGYLGQFTQRRERREES
jgi:hypothetical protein